MFLLLYIEIRDWGCRGEQHKHQRWKFNFRPGDQCVKLRPGTHSIPSSIRLCFWIIMFAQPPLPKKRSLSLARTQSTLFHSSTYRHARAYTTSIHCGGCVIFSPDGGHQRIWCENLFPLLPYLICNQYLSGSASAADAFTGECWAYWKMFCQDAIERHKNEENPFGPMGTAAVQFCRWNSINVARVEILSIKENCTAVLTNRWKVSPQSHSAFIDLLSVSRKHMQQFYRRLTYCDFQQNWIHISLI